MLLSSYPITQVANFEGKNLRAAKHRFESLQKPLGRLVLHMQPLLVTMETLCRERAGKVTWPFKDLAGHLEIWGFT